jgi:hypothetical protein
MLKCFIFIIAEIGNNLENKTKSNCRTNTFLYQNLLKKLQKSKQCSTVMGYAGQWKRIESLETNHVLVAN